MEVGADLGPTFSFRGELFEASAEAARVFVALLSDQAEEIRGLVPTRPGSAPSVLQWGLEHPNGTRRSSLAKTSTRTCCL